MGPSATAMSFEHLRVTLEGEVACLVLNRPEAGNALTPDLLSELHEALLALSLEQSARALVITGAGRAFSTGGDLSVIRDTLDAAADPREAVDRSLGLLADVILQLRALPQPTVAAVNGQAAGAGFSLALACDVRIGSQAAVFNFAYGALGGSPDGGMTWFLPRQVPPARAVELLMEQPVLRAPAALGEGLLSEVVPKQELLNTASKRAGRLAAKSPHAVRSARALVDPSLQVGLREQLDHERELFAQAVEGEDFRAAVASVLDGRRPVFGRR